MMANELSDLIYCATQWVFTDYLILLVSMTIVDNKCFIDFYAVIDSIVISEKNVLLLVCSTLSSLLSYIFLSMKQALEIVAFAKQCQSFDTLLELE